MNKVIQFFRNERLYVLLLIFILLVNLAIFTSGEAKEKHAEAGAKNKAEDLLLKREDLEKLLAGNKALALIVNLASLVIAGVLLLGILIDGLLLSFKISGGMLDMATYRQAAARWGILDVLKVAILFLFFGYILMIIESALSLLYPVFKNDDFRMIVNSSMLDIIVFIFIIYFTVKQYKENLASLGISLRNFARNVFYGIAGYIAAVPVFIATLAVTIVIMNFLKYKPGTQPVVELFLKERNLPFLVYTVLFAAIFGPIVEELFFRGFVYKAFKKYTGVFWATLITSTIFAILHTNVVGFVPILILGILLTYLYEKTGTLISSITAHMMHNMSMVFFVLLLKQMKA